MIVVRSGFDSGEVAKAKAYEKATKWCESRGLVMVPISETSRDVDFGRRPGTATLTFRAVSPSDREYARPVMGRAPDHHQIIEVRNR